MDNFAILYPFCICHFFMRLKCNPVKGYFFEHKCFSCTIGFAIARLYVDRPLPQPESRITALMPLLSLL